ncbi:MerR family transcriptional regulator [uncultured Clostridium sp.]|uniref:MerR family transcriptional regulator n=1 Tax=uncultured Clostridium sp. TaxID=59620 RepID=UPI0025F69BB0|nr:MerR family transcriptional regulator [uncultured Clostridium sp.]
MYKVKDIADIVGTSVRTLHHYDDIGLLTPDSVTEKGYRLYSLENLERLQQILFFKELDFNLNEIKEILDNPNFDKKEALNNHKKLLEEKVRRLKRIINTVDNTINNMEEGIAMNEKIMFDGFNSDEINKYKEEVKDKYGKTDAYREYKNKTFNYKKGDWNNLNKEMLDIFKRISDKMDLDPGSNEVQELVEEWRNYISKNLYNCSKQIFKSLGEMYVCDERFKNNIDKIKYGLAQFLSDAIKIYCN